VSDNIELRTVIDYASQVDKGVYTDANGQIALFKFNATEAAADNDDDIIKPNDISGGNPGRWVRQFIIPQASKDVVLGTPPAGGDWANGISQYSGTEKVNKVLLDHEEYFLRIAPVKPQSIISATMLMTVYAALEAATGTLHSNLTDDTQPIGLIEDFYDPEAGDLTAEVDTVQDGLITLTTGDDTGSNLSLAILENVDPHAGAGKPDEGWWMQLTVQVQSDSVLSGGIHSYQMKHSTVGDNSVLNFIIDDPLAVTIINIVINLPGSVSRRVSGVPSLDIGQTISCDFRVENAVQTHYNQIRLAAISGVEVDNINVAPPGTPPVNGAPVDYTSQAALVSTSVYIENVQVSIVGYNSKDEAGVVVPTATGGRVDTMSDESIRLVAGAGEFPASGYGGAFDPSISLINGGAYEEELQMLEAEYRRPLGNYIANLPIAGPDYTGSATNNAWDYCISIAVTALINASSFELNILGAVGFTGVETPDVRIQVKVEGVTGWLDANKAFSLVGSPVNNGDAAMVFSESSAILKKVTFGATPRTGDLYVRIGLPAGDSKRFTGVSITNIV